MGGNVQTVVARFHHTSRDLDEIERDMRTSGADDAVITGYTVAITFDADSHKEATKKARRALDAIGATRIKITKQSAKHTPREDEPVADQ
jgi:hypothetical protein